MATTQLGLPKDRPTPGPDLSTHPDSHQSCLSKEAELDHITEGLLSPGLRPSSGKPHAGLH